LGILREPILGVYFLNLDAQLLFSELFRSNDCNHGLFQDAYNLVIYDLAGRGLLLENFGFGSPYGGVDNLWMKAMSLGK